MLDVIALILLLIPMLLIGGLFATAGAFFILAVRQARKDGRVF